jgi:hypothetical protein
MTDEQRKMLHDRLMEWPREHISDQPEELRLYDESTTEDIEKLEPLIDEMINGKVFEIFLSRPACIQILTFLRAYEWREPRPGYVNCPECHIEFQATPESHRYHHPRCAIAGLIKEVIRAIFKNDRREN